MQMLVQRVFLIHHMKRSGGHAVINWLAAHTPSAAFVNNAVPIQAILDGRRSIPDGSLPYADWLRKVQRQPKFANTLAVASNVLVSVEDQELRVRPFHHATARTIVILRHPQNLFASRIRKACQTVLSAYDLTNPQILGRAISVWKEHARVALGSTDASGPPKAIFYDAWLNGEGYRARLARDFGFATPQEPSADLTKEGGGSSFGQAQVRPSDLLRRADFLSETEAEVLSWIMSDPEVADLADRVAAEVARLSGAAPRATVAAA